MNSSTYLIRLTRVLVLGAVVAGTASSAAGAKAPVGGQPYRDTASSQGYQSRPVAIPDVVERYATAHPYGGGLSDAPYRDPARSQGYQNRPVAIPDVLERYATAHPYGSGIASTVSQPNGFEWGDYAIGIGTGMGLILILAGGLALGRQRRHGVQAA